MLQELYRKIAILNQLDEADLSKRIHKTTEELGELTAAYLSVKGTSSSYKKKTTEDIAEEGVDLLICSVSILAQLEISNEKLNELINLKLQKWETKTKESKLNL